MKRLVDIAVASIGLAILLPLLLITAAAVGLCLGRPIFFRQERPGRHGVPFRILKFRTMTSAQRSDGLQEPDAVRLTKLGRFLRSCSIDELPELWNVLIGDMSMVGPRPLLMEYLPLYSVRQARRHEVRPGLTGWAQVNGRNALSWEERLELDVWYVDNHSFLLDLRILWATLFKVIHREGISAAGQATMSRFRGNESSPGLNHENTHE